MRDRLRARQLIHRKHNYTADEINKRQAIFTRPVGSMRRHLYCEPSFRCDYGYNIFLVTPFTLTSTASCLMFAQFILADGGMLARGTYLYRHAPLDCRRTQQRQKVGKPVTIE